MANYVNGGHYNPHHDYVMKEREPDHVRERGPEGDDDSERGNGREGSLTLGGILLGHRFYTWLVPFIFYLIQMRYVLKLTIYPKSNGAKVT